MIATAWATGKSPVVQFLALGDMGQEEHGVVSEGEEPARAVSWMGHFVIRGSRK